MNPSLVSCVPLLAQVRPRAPRPECAQRGASRPRQAACRACALACALCAGVSANARADPIPGPAAATEPSASDGGTRAFRYRQPEAPDYLRATLEEVGVLGIGYSQYLVNHDINSRDWDLPFSWTGVREKLGPSGYSFDTNGFNTNFVGHPGAGVLYYWVARSNRLTVFESLAYASVSSLLWEYLGELRERASINDLLATPVSGIALGEVTLQLGLFFDRSCDTVPNRVLGAVFGPFKAVHDALDGAEPLRDERCDRYGLSVRGEHEFRLSFALGDLITTTGPRTAPRLEKRLLLHTRVVALDDYGTPGEGFTTFGDGNVSEFWLGGAWAGSEWDDFRIRGALVPIGMLYRSLSISSAGTWGYEVLLGLLLGAEYHAHRFGSTQDGTRQGDRYFALDLPGASLGIRSFMGAVRLELELQTSVALAGIDAFALPQYLQRHSIDTLASVTRLNGYNYAAGVRINPRAKLVWNWLEAGAELTGTWLSVLTSLDRYPDRQSHVSGSELRTAGDVWLRVGPRDWPLRLSLSGGLLRRSGAIASSRASRSELRLLGGIDAVL